MGGDSGRYIQASLNLIKGLPLTQEQWSYLAYEWLLAPIHLLGGGLFGVVVVQCILALIGAFFLYRTGKKMFSPTAGVAAAILYLVNPSIQRWNFYILTETIATSALIAVTASAVLEKDGKGWKWALIPAAFILALARPETLIFLLPVSAYLFSFRTSRSAFLGTGLLILVFAVWLIRPGSTASFGIMHQWLEGTYIWGYPGIGAPEFTGVIPKNLSLTGLIVHFLGLDPLWVLKVLSLRLYYFLNPARPFYSPVHNLAAMSIMAAVYGLAFWGTWKGKGRDVSLFWLIFLMQAALVALTWSDWDNRWLDRVMPFLTILAAGGGMALWDRFKLGLAQWAGHSRK